MGGAFALEVSAVGSHGTAAHHGVADDERGALGLGIGGGYGLSHCHGVGAVDLDNVPVPGTVFGGVVLGVDSIDISRELHSVRVIEHDQIGKAEVTGNAACALRDLFLYTAVGNEGVGFVGP